MDSSIADTKVEEETDTTKSNSTNNTSCYSTSKNFTGGQLILDLLKKSAEQISVRDNEGKD